MEVANCLTVNFIVLNLPSSIIIKEPVVKDDTFSLEFTVEFVIPI